jgi:hypothetical protein
MHDFSSVHVSSPNVPGCNPAIDATALQVAADGISHFSILRGITDKNINGVFHNNQSTYFLSKTGWILFGPW